MLWNRKIVVAMLAVLAPTIALATDIKPAGGERLAGGDSYEIRWKAGRANLSVTIDLWNGNTSRWYRIASGINAKRGFFEWIVPTDLYGDRFRVRVTSQDGYSAMSGTYFSILQGNSLDPNATHSLALGRSLDSVQVESIPAVGTLSIRASWAKGEALSIALCDLSGRVLERASGDLSSSRFIEFDVGRLPRGAYFVQVVFTTGRLGIGRALVR